MELSAFRSSLFVLTFVMPAIFWKEWSHHQNISGSLFFTLAMFGPQWVSIGTLYATAGDKRHQLLKRDLKWFLNWILIIAGFGGILAIHSYLSQEPLFF